MFGKDAPGLLSTESTEKNKKGMNSMCWYKAPRIPM